MEQILNHCMIDILIINNDKAYVYFFLSDCTLIVLLILVFVNDLYLFFFVTGLTHYWDCFVGTNIM